MKNTVTLKTLMLIGLSVVSVHSFAYPSHDDHNNHGYEHAKDHHAVDYRPVKVVQVSHDSHRDQYNRKDFTPHTHWKTGYVLPNQYRAKGYQVYRYKGAGLQAPGKNQQWFKIKGDYVLVNVVNDHIIRIISSR